MIKKIIISFITVVLTAIVIFWVTLFPPMPSKSRLDKVLKKNEPALSSAVQFFQTCTYKSLWLRYRDNEITAFCIDELKDKSGVVGAVILEDSVLSQMKDLFEKGNYQLIAKNNNYVIFQKWANLDVGVGILYLLEGDKPRSKDYTFLVFEELSIDNWYYYKEK